MQGVRFFDTSCINAIVVFLSFQHAIRSTHSTFLVRDLLQRTTWKKHYFTSWRKLQKKISKTSLNISS